MAQAPLVELSAAKRQSLRNLLDHLEATREKLLLVQPSVLSDAKHREWNEQVYQTGLAISRVRLVLLRDVAKAFADQLVSIEAATDQLTDDLYNLKKANEIIGAVANVMGVITNIVRLLG